MLKLKETALNLLERDLDAEYYEKEITERYTRVFNTLKMGGNVVIAGNSPYTHFLKAKLQDKYNCRVTVVDTETDGDAKDISYLKDSPDNFVYIISSTKYLGFYSRILMARGITRIIPYHALPILDDELDFSRKAYSSAFFRSGNNSIIQNKEEYRELLLSMSDDESLEIMARLICYMLTADYIYAPVSYHKDLYFGHDFLKLTANEVCVDGGGFNGDTLAEYLRNYESFSSYWLFEPELKLLNEAKERYAGWNNIHYLNIGLYDRAETLAFQSNGEGMGRIVEAGDMTIQTCRLDDVIEGPVSVIKLDIEGSEFAALRGSRRIISEYKPTLAISVYHNIGDVLTLSRFVKSLVPEYKFYLRCGFESLFNDLVLFASV